MAIKGRCLDIIISWQDTANVSEDNSLIPRQKLGGDVCRFPIGDLVHVWFTLPITWILGWGINQIEMRGVSM